MADSPWVVIAGGGTAGHVHPGLAIAEALVARGLDRDDVHFVGSERGLEAELVPSEGFSITTLPGRGIQRRLTMENVRSVLGIASAVGSAFGLLRRLRPKVIVSVGGFASVPCSAAAAALRIPIVVAEQNTVPGAANRFAARFAKVSAVSFAGTDLPRAVHTGNPLRGPILSVDRVGGRASARAALGVGGGRRLVSVFGGSLGARRLNEATVGACEAWSRRDDLAVRHIIGARDFDSFADRIATLDQQPGGLQYDAVAYEDQMHEVYAASDLVVCRAGATSVAELAATGTPAVLVPLPGAPGDHQTKNARALSTHGGAILVPDSELDAERLGQEVAALFASPDRLAVIADVAATLGRRDAADRVAALVEEYANA